MSVNKYEDIETVHLEVTSKCNALCPQCARSIFGSRVNPNIDQKELKLEDIKEILKPEFIKQLKFLYLNGNYGDPATATDVIEILDYIKTHNPNIRLNLHSNGGPKSPGWWSKLATFFKDSGSMVHFGLDGLEDTNHLYRVNVKWDRAIANVKAFIEAGGSATWDFIVFKHNQHQVEKARVYSKHLGFKNFIIKKTGRFATNHIGKFEVRAHPVYKKDGSFSHLLEAPSDQRFLNYALKEDEKSEEYNSETFKNETLDTDLKNNMHNNEVDKFYSNEEIKKINDCEIDCYVQKEKSIYIDYNGKAFPCCWLAWPYYAYWEGAETIQTREVINKLGGYDMLDTKKFSIEEVNEGPFFKYVKRSFSKKGTLDRAVSCSKTCGTCHKHLTEERGVSIK